MVIGVDFEGTMTVIGEIKPRAPNFFLFSQASLFPLPYALSSIENNKNQSKTQTNNDYMSYVIDIIYSS